jgi:hypothetical protein
MAMCLFQVSARGSLPEYGMFTVSDFAHLRFLEGRWIGKGPDGSDFYDEYLFSSKFEIRSNRYPDDTFTTPSDGSTVALQNGQVTSTWREFSWQASELTPGRACFAPVKAPSSFCWERVSDSEVHVTQRWSDENGDSQVYVVPLRRL